MTIPIKCLKFPYSKHLLYLGVLVYSNYLIVIINNTDIFIIIDRQAKYEKYFWVVSHVFNLTNTDESPPLKRGI